MQGSVPKALGGKLSSTWKPRKMRVFSIALVLLLSLVAAATPLEEAARRWQQSLKILPGGSGAQSAFLLLDVSGRARLAWNEGLSMLPASTLKVATAVAILEQPGAADVRLTTRLQLQGERLRWVGDYDPELRAQDMEEMLLAMAPRLPARLQLEVSPPESQPYPAGWAWDDLSSAFAPLISRLTFDHGLITLRLQAGQQLQIGGPAWMPPNSIGFLPGSEELGLRVLPGWEGWVLEGQMVLGSEEALSVPMLRPELALARLSAAVLQRRGISVELTSPLADFAAEHEVVHESRPVRELLRQGLADSDNLVLECLYRRFGSRRPSVWQESFRVVDGSGLSRYNLVSVQGLLQALRSRPEVLELLPLAGREGTMKRRFLNTPLEGRLRAKTGTMSGVSGLVGELKGHLFALLLSGYVGPSAPYKKAEEELIVELSGLLDS